MRGFMVEVKNIRISLSSSDADSKQKKWYDNSNTGRQLNNAVTSSTQRDSARSYQVPLEWPLNNFVRMLLRITFLVYSNSFWVVFNSVLICVINTEISVCSVCVNRIHCSVLNEYITWPCQYTKMCLMQKKYWNII